MESPEQPQTKPRPNIKDNWLKEDILCEKCGQVTYKQKGITKQSMQRLFKFDWKNPQEWVWTLVIIGIIFAAWAYKTDMAAYNEFRGNQVEYCTQLLNYIDQHENGLENGLGQNVFVFNVSGSGSGLGNVNNNTNPWNP